jgi:hypothetical protein
VIRYDEPGVVASAIGVEEGEVEAWARDLRQLARVSACFFSLNRYIFPLEDEAALRSLSRWPGGSARPARACSERRLA